MPRPKKPSDLKGTVEKKLADALAAATPPDEQSMKLLHLAIKYLAVQAKLEEGEYGDFFADEPDTGDQEPERPQHRPRKRANGDAAAAEPGETRSLLDS